MLEAIRSLIQRIAAAKDKRALIADLNAWADTIVRARPPAIPTKMEHEPWWPTRH